MPEKGRKLHIRQDHCTSTFIFIFASPFYFFYCQAYLEVIKEIKDEEAKKKGEEVKNLTKAEETAEETKAENPAEESKEANILESEAKKIILETTFENPTPTEIQQIVKNESKPLAEKKED